MAEPRPADRAALVSGLLARTPARVLLFGLGYFLLCRLGDELTSSQGDFSTFWPASGFLMAALLLTPAGHWRWYLAALVVSEAVAGVAFGRRLGVTVAFALADAVEGLAGATLARRVAGGPLLARHPVRDTLALVLLAGALGAALSALIATAGMYLAYGTGKVDLQVHLGQWWAGNAMGTLVLAPALLSWSVPTRLWPAWTARRAAEAAALTVAGAGAALLVFGSGDGVHMERGYLLLPALGWAAYRFGLRGASALGAAITFLAAWSTARGLPYVSQLHRQLNQDTEVQLLLAVSLSAALLFAAAFEERARADEARRESEALFDAFLAHSPAALFILDSTGRLRFGSRSFERMMGRPTLQLAGQTATEALADDEGAAAAAEDARVLQGGAPVRVDRRVAGRVHDVVKFRIDRGGGEPLLGGVAVDVTEQRLALRSLRLAQVALDRNFTSLLFVEPSGLVTYANEAAGRLWERPHGALIGRSLWELDAAFEEASWPEAWGRLRAGGSLLLEGRLEAGRGRLVEAEVGLAFVAFDGQEYAVYAARDLTERRQAEAAQRLASVGTLAAGMAHEINNPLTFVAANLAFALDRLGPLRTDPRAVEVAKALEDAEEGTRRVARVVRDLKAVSRVEVEARHPVDVRAEVETALKLAQNELRHRATLVEVLDEVPRALAPEFQLGQVFLNLLVNAAHAVGDGDPSRHTVRVATRTSPEGWIVVEVADTGAGIPPELLGRIFEPFFTTKPIGQGTGLGLSVCHGIVSGLGGRIEVESRIGEGSTFRVMLPPTAAVQPPLPEATRPPAEGARARILAIDDELLIGSTIRRLLSHHDVVVLTDPREALARLLEGEHFDLVLCDLMMPQLSGMELYQTLARSRPEAARRVVFMTGGAFTERAREFLEWVGRPQLAKPFAPQELREAVRGWLARGFPHGP